MNTIQGSFGWSNEALPPAMSEAERIVRQGAAKIQSTFAQAFKRSPNMRAERAISGSLQAFASGDIAGGIEAITGRMTGLGLAAGVALGAGVAVFVKWKEQAAAADAEVEKIREHLGTPMKMASIEGIKEDFSESMTNVKGVEKASKTWGARIRQAFRDEGKNSWFDAGLNPSGTERKDIGNPQLLAANAERERATENVKHLAELEERVVEARRLGLEVGTKEGQIAELRQKTAKELEKNAGEFGPTKVGSNIFAFMRMQESIKKDSQLTEDSIDKQAASRERNLSLEEKMAKLVKGGLKGEDQKKVLTSLELEDINKQIASGKNNPEELRNLRLQKTQKENDLRGFGTPTFAAGTIANRQFESDQGGFGSIAQRSKETQDASAFGSLGFNAAQRGDIALPKAGPSPEVAQAIEGFKTALAGVMGDYWGAAAAK